MQSRRASVNPWGRVVPPPPCVTTESFWLLCSTLPLCSGHCADEHLAQLLLLASALRAENSPLSGVGLSLAAYNVPEI
jgi:hypothetical protein